MSSDETLTPYQEFLQRFRGYGALQAETGYALPKPLITAITKHAPKFFHKDELAFERSLAQLPATGWFHDRPFSYPLLSHLHPEPEDSFRQWAGNQDAELQQLQDELKSAHGMTTAQITRFRKAQQDMQGKLNRIALGYAGWLVTHPAFRSDVHFLQEKWSPLIREASGIFPAVRQSVLGYAPPGDEYWHSHSSSPQQRSGRSSTARRREESPRLTARQELVGEFVQLHNHWSLERLATWELPVPVVMEINQSQIYDANRLSPQVGVLLYVPWYLLFQKDLKLQDLISNHNQMAASGVAKWLTPTNHDKYGIDRYGIMLQLHVYLELALKRRYGDELRRSVKKLDEAFAEFFTKTSKKPVQSDTVRSIRLKMARRLKAGEEQS
ncbi:MAG TPA: hypothetical protein VNQ76_16295 [Planctomicrobium sp.]|nr:hypothetical protein [Planctomicrobium sp.]